MNENLLDILCCPGCKANLSLEKKVIIGSGIDDNSYDISEGILTCLECNKSYPVIDGIPRLCNNLWQLELEEEERIKKIAKVIIHEQKANDITNSEAYKQIEKIVREKWNVQSTASEYIKKKAEKDVCYQTKECEKQEKVIHTLKLYCSDEIKIILDIGGGTGGLIKCLNDYFNPIFPIMLDYDLSWIKVARLRCPKVQIVRGDAVNLPFKRGSIDCVFSMAMIEHIENYKKVIQEMCEVTKNICFVGWNPNKYFIYDIGHLDAPITLFPKKIARYVAIAWHRIRRTGRTKTNITRELETVFYVPTTHVKKVLCKYGDVFNVFVDFSLFSLKSSYSYRMGKSKNFFNKHLSLTKFILKLLVFFKIEPQCYYILRKKKNI